MATTIIITNYNYRRYLGDCIDSALAQSRPAEVIVVDDASTDGSQHLIATYGERVKAIFFTENLGQAAALNRAHAIATGDIVMYLDSDDLVDPKRVERIEEVFRDDERIVAVLHDARVIDDAGGTIAEQQYRYRPNSDPQADVIRFGRTVGSGGVLALRRTFVSQLGPIPETCYRRGPDAYLLLASALFGAMRTLDESLYVRRMHAAQMTQRFARDRSLTDLGLRRRYCEASSAASLATRFGGPEAIATLSTWWQQKALYEYAKSVKGAGTWVDHWFRHLQRTMSADLPWGRKVGELTRSIALGILPRSAFRRAYWRTHMGRPRLRRVDALNAASLMSREVP